jgi:plastocyanin
MINQVVDMKKLQYSFSCFSIVVILALAGCGADQQAQTSQPVETEAPQAIVATTGEALPAATVSQPLVATSTTSTGASDGALAVNPPIIDGTVEVFLNPGAFTPAQIWIPAGTTVEWQTEDHLSTHAVDGEDFALWGHVVYWQPFRMQFNTPGTYRYLDDADPNVRGTIVVY